MHVRSRTVTKLTKHKPLTLRKDRVGVIFKCNQGARLCKLVSNSTRALEGEKSPFRVSILSDTDSNPVKYHFLKMRIRSALGLV